jgi:hypothetical protein
MGGFLGIGHSSGKTDRANQLSATQGQWNVFNQGMAVGTSGEASGTGTLDSAKSTLAPAEKYYQDLMTAGRTQTASNAAPAVNATLAGADATRKAEGEFGTGRSGGTVAANRTAATTSQGGIDNIINQNLVSGKAAGAQGLQSVAGQKTAIGSEELHNAMAAMGLSSGAIGDMVKTSMESRGLSFDINSATQAQWGQLIGTLLSGGENN